MPEGTSMVDLLKWGVLAAVLGGTNLGAFQVGTGREQETTQVIQADRNWCLDELSKCQGELRACWSGK